ncbi:hypothetical protein SAMN05421676_11554 [Salinibacillus kushneri]|uniref:Uncharacterized protein n=1 Tax=Salinibacillus kushneri TaxID=237682 RepID=A0A1I0J1S6_9BACI|nr:hypothetical protein [Salinibacillus kushneri]SEU03614.1 hypothetical protein SAMN05421676_11554 [Salinibacillus kushneri]
MEAFQIDMKKIRTSFVEWGKAQIQSFTNWLSSLELEQFMQDYSLRMYFFLVMTPLFAVIPIFTFIGSFTLMTSHFLVSISLFLFSICSFFVFIGFPVIFLYIKYKHHAKWKIIWISSGIILLLSVIFWTIQYYLSFLPAI